MKSTISKILVVLLVVVLCHGCAQVRTNERAFEGVRNWWDAVADGFTSRFCQKNNNDTDVTNPAEDETEATTPTEPVEEVEVPEFFENSDKTVTMCRYEFVKWARDNEYGAFNVPHLFFYLLFSHTIYIIILWRSIL